MLFQYFPGHFTLTKALDISSLGNFFIGIIQLGINNIGCNFKTQLFLDWTQNLNSYTHHFSLPTFLKY